VAVTRARARLHLSGVVPLRRTGDELNFPSQCPLAWLDKHFGLAEYPGARGLAFPEDAAEGVVPVDWQREWNVGEEMLRVTVEPRPSAPAAAPEGRYEPVPIHPAPFERERPLFKVTSPSSLAVSEEEDDSEPSIMPETPMGSHPRLRGTLIHRLLADVAAGKKLPSAEAIRSHLGYEGVDAGRAEEMAGSALAEVERCVRDPWLSRCFALPTDLVLVEYPLESSHGPREIFAGTIDLAVCLDGKWRLIDYKTSRGDPGESPEALCHRELKRYAPQLAAYREMWAGLKGIDEEEIECYIYMTAFSAHQKLGEDQGTRPLAEAIQD
jgi:ATP-dependent exoDNAse (exonuclease V) beta subunit